MLKPAKSLPIAALILVLHGLITKEAMSSAQASSAVPTTTAVPWRWRELS